MAEFPAPKEAIVVTHFIVSTDVERSRRFYTDVLGGELVWRANPRSSRSQAVGASSMSAGDRPTTGRRSRSRRLTNQTWQVASKAPNEAALISSFLNIRVADIEAIYADWSERGRRVPHATEGPSTPDPSRVLAPLAVTSDKCSWTKRTTVAPSPTAIAQRLVDPARASPAA
jgi:catechol 2,3-dioxygenase-like lactoylglutathione lyase family enzyme